MTRLLVTTSPKQDKAHGIIGMEGPIHGGPQVKTVEKKRNYLDNYMHIDIQKLFLPYLGSELRKF